MPSPHRVLVVGAGSIGERHLRCLLATERASVSFVEVNPTLRATIAERYPAAKAFDSLENAIETPPDVAVVATPAPLHIPQATQLVERGVHVLIEKPLSIGLDGVDALRALVAQKKVVAGVAYTLRAQPALQELQQAIASGKFGKPLQLTAVSGQDFAFYRPAYANTYYANHASGGGAVQDALTHVLNAAQWLIGPADRVVADAAHLKIPNVNVEDTVHVIARHGDVLASFSLNQHQPANESTITIVCERATVRFELHEGRWRECDKPGEPWVNHDSAALGRDEPFIRQANGFLDAVEGKRPPLCTLDEGIATLRTNLAILKSIDQGQWVST